MELFYFFDKVVLMVYYLRFYLVWYQNFSFVQSWM